MDTRIHTGGEAPSDQALEVRVRALFEAQRQHQPQVRRTSAEERIGTLRRLREALLARRQDLHVALWADFRKPAVEVDLTEIMPVLTEIKHAVDQLPRWMAPRRVKATPPLLGTRAEVRCEPKGVSLIIAPWNYPVTLTLGPLVSAVAAGCCCVLKPSEFTPHTTAVLRELLAAVFEEREVAVVEGDATAAQALLAQPFDHVFFTGSPRVGRLVMQAAARHLASVTLELGGKSPAIVDETADVGLAAEKIAQGKFTNAGQTCIAPDYVLVHTAVHDALTAALREQVHRFYGATPADRAASPDYPRLIHDGHWQRLAGWLEDALARGAEVVVGGRRNAAERYLEPTVLTGVAPDDPLMTEEIFGPILPVLRFETLDEALALVNARPKPLALYVFTESEAHRERILQETSAGGTCVNDTLLHFIHPELPFGGVGHSGLGKSHGHYGFLAFSNERAVLHQKLKKAPIRLLYPPYGPRVRRLAAWVLKYF
ncbi:aldehyde dehydrogenase family protein [Rhodothermaceae bacterium RA]|nr:aldehyde dehydrogenase family protein [Rhodothermaceae bacterium RA]